MAKIQLISLDFYFLNGFSVPHTQKCFFFQLHANRNGLPKTLTANSQRLLTATRALLSGHGMIDLCRLIPLPLTSFFLSLFLTNSISPRSFAGSPRDKASTTTCTIMAEYETSSPDEEDTSEDFEVITSSIKTFKNVLHVHVYVAIKLHVHVYTLSSNWHQYWYVHLFHCRRGYLHWRPSGRRPSNETRNCCWNVPTMTCVNPPP